MSLVGYPKIEFLDEPTTGVDPVSCRSLFKMLKSLDESSMILTTHRMDEAEHERGHDRRAQQRHHDAPHGLPGARAQRQRCLVEALVDLCEGSHARAHAHRHVAEDEADDEDQARSGHLDRRHVDSFRRPAGLDGGEDLGVDHSAYARAIWLARRAGLRNLDSAGDAGFPAGTSID